MSQFDRIEQNEIEKIAKKVVAAAGGGGSGTVTQVDSGTGLTGGPITTTGTLSVSFGNTGTTACVGNDARLSDARTPIAHVHAASDVTSGTLNIARIPTGTLASTVCIGNDARLSNARAPISHAADHATLGTDPISPASIGAAAASHTHAAGDVTSGTLNIARIPTGTSGTTVCIGNDARLSDARIPTAHTHPQSDITNLVTDLASKASVLHVHSASDVTTGTFAIGRIPTGSSSTTVCIGDDARLSDSRSPISHAGSHASLGSDPLSPGDIGAAAASHTHAQSDVTNLVTDLAGKSNVGHTHAAADIASGVIATARLASSGTASATTYLRGDQRWATIPSTNLGDGDYGDITVSGTGTVMTIDNSTVTISKINATGTPSGTTFLRGDGTWSSPTSSGTVTQVDSGTGLTGGPITTTGTLSVSFGNTASTVCVGNDARLSDARTPLAHTHAATDVTSGVFNIAQIPTGSTGTTVCVGNDTRLSDARAPTAHTHPQSEITNLVTDLAAKAALSHTHAAGDVTSGTFNIAQIPTGNTVSTVCIGNDSRLSDARTPLTHTHAAADVTSGVFATARLASTGTPSATTFLRGDQQWATPAGGSLSISRSILTTTQANSTVTPAVLTGCTFTLTPGQSITLSANLIFTAAATTTGAALGVRVAQAASANANATGSAVGYVNLQNAAGATGLCDGDQFDVAASGNTLFEVLGTATTAGNNAARIEALVWNRSTNVNTTVTVEFRSEVAASAVTAQIGSGAVAIIG